MDVMFCKYCWNILIAIDQLVNTLFGGDPDETISSRLGKWTILGNRLTGTRKIIYKVANFSVELFERDHFKKSIEPDEGDRKIIE
jgi:hypothetical protein